ncbi:hypothetical protein ABFS82_08G153900 [Erythranthe guttata]|nr:PREDICTED: uncharacterized protein LOC105961967 [Erythranthe guttata]|eukprot:XP_012841679.1 PREDICTED: uncharacterized protein LOC105961967 [Erythranthe guttata]
MEKKIWSSSRIKILFVLTTLILSEISSPAAGCPSDGSQCKSCIMNRMKTGCPGCVPIMQCMARCLWGGASRPNCTKKCDCSGGYPRLADCKKCLSQCKCSCVASA